MNTEDSITSFEELNLREEVIRGIYSYGFEKPSLIQSLAIPKMLSGKDLIAQAHSGTGKTATFLISVLQKIDLTVEGAQAIVLAHTHELAEQIYDVCKNLCHYMKVTPVLCVGGQKIEKTRDELYKNTTIVIGTPGRIIDLINRSYLSTRSVKILVVDEADEMLSRNFQPQVKNVIEQLPMSTQMCIFSATLPSAVFELTEKFMNSPEKILVANEKLTLDGIKQYYINIQKDRWKFETFCELYTMISVSQTIVYVNSIKRANILKEALNERNFPVSMIHSDMSSTERADIMREFKGGSTRILISTDLLARGIDIQQISIVINYDLPRNKECYIHRIGRSGRFGRKGVAINFITDDESRQLRDLISYYKTEITEMPKNIQDLIF